MREQQYILLQFRATNGAEFIAQVPGCMISLMPIRGIDGGISVDLGYYHSMATSAREMNRNCVGGMYSNGKTRRFKKSGGFTHVGTRGNLILSFYASGSPFDIAIAEWRQGVPLTCQAKGWEVKNVATEVSSSIDAGSCTGTEQNFWDSLSDITQLIMYRNLTEEFGDVKVGDKVTWFSREVNV